MINKIERYEETMRGLKAASRLITEGGSRGRGLRSFAVCLRNVPQEYYYDVFFSVEIGGELYRVSHPKFEVNPKDGSAFVHYELKPVQGRRKRKMPTTEEANWAVLPLLAENIIGEIEALVLRKQEQDRRTEVEEWNRKQIALADERRKCIEEV